MNHNKQWSSALVSPYEQAREKENKIENLPMEIVGKIFDQIGEARHVVVASATCKMWRKVWKDYTCALSFNSNMYRDFHTSTFEVIIAQTISQTRGLKSLSIVMEYDHDDHQDLHIDKKTELDLSNPSLKNFFVEDINMAKFIISKVDCLENLHIKNCAIEFFKLVSKGALKTLEIDSSDLININIIGNTNNFESVDVYNSTIMWSSIYSMLIKKSSKIKRIKLCYVDFYEEDDEDIDMENLSSSTMALFMSMNNNNVMVLIGKSKEEFDLEN
ncbi:hypothetical protein CsatB_016515 [Cannabis sativa]